MTFPQSEATLDMTATLNWATFSPQARLSRRLHKVGSSCPVRLDVSLLALPGSSPYYDRPQGRLRAEISGLGRPCCVWSRRARRGGAPTHRAAIPATVPMTVGGQNRVIPTFRARASRPAAQESPRGPAGVRRKYFRSRVVHFPLIWGIYGRCTVTSFGGSRFNKRREMKKTNLKWETIAIT